MERCHIHTYSRRLKKKFGLLICLLACLSTGCSYHANQSSEAEYYRRLPVLGKTESEGLITLARPVPDNIHTNYAQIDSIRKVRYEKGLALLVYGKLPGPCCHLNKASTKIQDDTLFITISTWQIADSVCSGQFIPFRYANKDLPTAEFEAVKVYKTANAVHRFMN